MRRILAAVVTLVLATQASAHSLPSNQCDYSILNGTWTAFYPDGKNVADSLSEGALLSIRHDSGKKYEVELTDTAWEIHPPDDLYKSKCTEGVLSLSVPVRLKAMDDVTAELTVQRVNSVVELMKRSSDPHPSLRQLDIWIEPHKGAQGKVDEGRITPGHVHADN